MIIFIHKSQSHFIFLAYFVHRLFEAILIWEFIFDLIMICVNDIKMQQHFSTRQMSATFHRDLSIFAQESRGEFRREFECLNSLITFYGKLQKYLILDYLELIE